MDVGRSPGVVVVAPGICSRLNGGKTILAVGIGQHTARAHKVRVKWCIVLIDFMDVAATSVRLPYLDQGVRYRPVIFIEYLSSHDDPFPNRLTIFYRIAREIII